MNTDIQTNTHSNKDGLLFLKLAYERMMSGRMQVVVSGWTNWE